MFIVSIVICKKAPEATPNNDKIKPATTFQ